MTTSTTGRGALLALVVMLLAACGQSSQKPKGPTGDGKAGPSPTVTPAEARDIAKQAYIYGVPMISLWQAIYAYSLDPGNPAYRGPLNSVMNIARVFTPDDKAFVTPNSDTPYTFIGLDLRAEPVVISVPPIDPKRYYVFQLMDLYTYNFAYIGTRSTGSEGGNFMVAGPGWSGDTPQGITSIVHSETDLVSVVGRTQLFNPKDLANVEKIQAQYQVRPLSVFLGEGASPSAPAVEWLKPLAPEQARTSLEFFDQLAFLLQFALPPHQSEVQLRDQFAKIGIVPGKRFDPASLSPAVRDAMLQGMKDGQAAIDAKRASLGGATDKLFGDRAFLGEDYLSRAVGTQVGIGANSREEAMYPLIEKDSTGAALDGTTHRYLLTFAKDQLPPVDAFWSVTMYGLPDQLLVKNPVNRYLINSPMLPQLKKNADGSLTIHVQADSPGKAKESNWLPAPKGPFMLALRYYMPGKAILDGSWTTPPLVATPLE